jgi:hypothetical protein
MSVRNTVTETLASNGLSSYASRAEPVIVALETREQQIVDSLVETATRRFNVDGNTVKGLLTEAGLHYAEPEPEVATTDVDVPTVLAQINQTLQGLTAFARRHGYSG